MASALMFGDFDMKMLFGAIALTIAIPAVAQTAPSTGTHANAMQLHAAQGQQQLECSKEEVHRHCQDMLNDQAKADRLAKKRAAKLDAEFNGNGHQGHKH